ncbi:MAG: DUF2244 domain-containing protein [Pseudomonadota bacterium]
MPYAWTDHPEAGAETLQLWPHQSLPPKGFAAFIIATFAMILLPLLPLLGTVVLWGLLPFLMLAVGGIWFALQKSWRDGQISEVLTLTEDRAHLVRRNPRGDTQEWDCNRHWASTEMHEKGGPVPHYVTLRGSGREVEIGRFLSEDERKALYLDLLKAMRQAQP